MHKPSPVLLAGVKNVNILWIWSLIFFLKQLLWLFPASRVKCNDHPAAMKVQNVCHSCHNHAGVALHSWEIWTSSSSFYCLLYGCFEAVTHTRLMLLDQDLLCQINFIKLFKCFMESQLQAFQLSLAAVTLLKALHWWIKALYLIIPQYCWNLNSDWPESVD